jgi:hypothetical protein
MAESGLIYNNYLLPTYILCEHRSSALCGRLMQGVRLQINPKYHIEQNMKWLSIVGGVEK